MKKKDKTKKKTKPVTKSKPKKVVKEKKETKTKKKEVKAVDKTKTTNRKHLKLSNNTKKIDEAYAFIKEQSEEGKTVLFVGTKKQAQECMKEAAQKCGMYYVDQRWLGGMLTNFGTIRKRVQRLRDLEAMETDGTFDVLPKKEVILLKKEMEKLEKNLGGIKEMDKIPGVMFIVDPKKERIGISEENKLKK